VIGLDWTGLGRVLHHQCCARKAMHRRDHQLSLSLSQKPKTKSIKKAIQPLTVYYESLMQYYYYKQATGRERSAAVLFYGTFLKLPYIYIYI
jgi:hypothetical protein